MPATDIFNRAIQRVAPLFGGGPTPPPQPQINTNELFSLPSLNRLSAAPQLDLGNPVIGGGQGDFLGGFWGRRAKQQLAQQGDSGNPGLSPGYNGGFGLKNLPNYAQPGDDNGFTNLPHYWDPGDKPSLVNLAQHTDRINQAAQRTNVPAGIYAAAILGESQGDPLAVNPDSGATGLLQALPLAGRGGNYSREQLQDPDFNLQLADDDFKQAYNKAFGQGYRGPDLWGATIAYAQRYGNSTGPDGRYNPNSPESQMFRGHIDRVWQQGQTRQIDGTQMPTPGAVRAGKSQFTLGLPLEVANAFCGPTAAMWFAEHYGRTPTAYESMEMAKQVGWTPEPYPGGPGGGMAGPASEVQLLRNIGIDAYMEAINPQRVASEVAAGRPVILNTPGHYYQVTGYDPNKNLFQFGDAVGRGRWGRLEDIGGAIGPQFGAPDVAIYSRR